MIGASACAPHAGLTLCREGAQTNAATVSDWLGEVHLTERAVADGLTLANPPTAVVLVENLGPYIDVTAPHGWLIAYVPGTNTLGAEWLLRHWPTTPALLFGDLDPNGYEAFCRLRLAQPALRWFAPDWWAEHLPASRAKSWPSAAASIDVPPLVRRLMVESRWLEQEAIALDPRLTEAFGRAIR